MASRPMRRISRRRRFANSSLRMGPRLRELASNVSCAPDAHELEELREIALAGTSALRLGSSSMRVVSARSPQELADVARLRTSTAPRGLVPMP